MEDLSEALSQQELDWLGGFLSHRIGDDIETITDDMGILSISELDGFLTAVASGPVTIPPSHWLTAVWGAIEPEWKSEAEFKHVFSLMIRHMNNIIDALSNNEEFEALFSEVKIEDGPYILVDDWCYGYMQGVYLAEDKWGLDDQVISALLEPMKLFSSHGMLKKLDQLNESEVDKLQNAVEPNAREIYSYWLTRRQDFTPLASGTYHREEPRTGRNDPCPCGSGKKYKKCCLQ